MGLYISAAINHESSKLFNLCGGEQTKMGLTVQINDGKAHDKKGENKSAVTLSTSSAGLDVNISTSPSATFKPTFSIKPSGVPEWKSRQAHYDTCVGKEVEIPLIIIHGCGQIEVDGSPFVTINGCSGQIKINPPQEKEKIIFIWR